MTDTDIERLKARMRGLQIRFFGAIVLALAFFQVHTLSGESAFFVAAKAVAIVTFVLLLGYALVTWFVAFGVARQLKRLRRSSG